jgi:hypothetical protein
LVRLPAYRIYVYGDLPKIPEIVILERNEGSDSEEPFDDLILRCAPG